MHDSETLRGRTALVTGAARRIGKSIATALAGEGVNVLIHFNSSQKEAEELALELRRLGVQAWTVKADLADSSQVGDLWRRAEQMVQEEIDILINNASIFPADRLIDLSPDQLHLNIQVNALAPLLISRAFAGRSHNHEGAIVNLLDCRMEYYDREHVSYHLSKRILFSITKMMAVEFAPGIRVNGIAPGLILPPPELDREQGQLYLRRLSQTNLLSKWGRPEDITQAVLFLLKSDFITGQVIYVDGGRFLKGGMYG